MFNRLKRKTITTYSKVTAHKRVLPNTLIVGTQKGGTSSLYYYLIQHPQIHESSHKEVHYFDGGLDQNVDTFEKSENWYRSHFPLQKHVKNNDAIIEATPLYLFNPLCPQRIHNLIPNCKIILLLRNPVERAISHYFHVKRHGFESLPIQQALEQEESRLAIVGDNYKHPNFRLYSYKARGHYLEQLKTFQKHFKDQNMLIMSSEEMFQEPGKTLTKVFEFLDLDNNFKVPDLKSQNIGANKLKVDDRTYTYLTDYFMDKNSALFRHLGNEFNW